MYYGFVTRKKMFKIQFIKEKKNSIYVPKKNKITYSSTEPLAWWDL